MRQGVTASEMWSFDELQFEVCSVAESIIVKKRYGVGSKSL